MNFAHYTEEPVTLAVDLVNTFGWVSGNEYLATLSDLEDFLHSRMVNWTHDAPAPTEADLPAIHRLRLQLRSTFEADSAEEAAATLNQVLAECRATPRLSVHEEPAHLHFEPDGGSLAEWLGVVTAMGLATLVADHGIDRLGLCQADTCDDAFVDTSRNRSRRHCSVTCGTREHVAAHRRRRRQEN